MSTDTIRAALVADLAAVTAERDDLVTEVARLRREVGSLIRQRAGLQQRRRFVVP